MKNKWAIAAVLAVFLFQDSPEAQERSAQPGDPGKQLIELNKRLCQGWNTWNTNSVLSHVLLPEGIAVDLQLLDHRHGDTLKEALIGKESYGTKEHVVPGPHAYDGSYTELTVEWHQIRLRVQTAARGNSLYLLVSPLGHADEDSLIVCPRLLWGAEGDIQVGRTGITWKTASGTQTLSVAAGSCASSAGGLSFSLDHAIALSSGGAVSAGDIQRTIGEAKATCERARLRYKGSEEEYNAMQTVLAWNTVYDGPGKRAITPVSRNWCVGWQGWILFEWDNYFAAYMLSLDNKGLAYANAIAITKEITKGGFVPNYASAVCKSEDRSEPPVGSLVVDEIYKRYHEKWFLREVFDGLLSWNRWWADRRDIDGYLVWGSDPYRYGNISKFLIKGIGTKKGAQWESGLDNSPMWDEAVFDSSRHRLMQADVGLMSLYVADCRALSDIATALGKTAIARELNGRAEKYAKKLSTLWDERSGLYLNRSLLTGQFSHRLSPTLFYPLLAKIPNRDQALTMIRRHFYNRDEFYGQYIMPSIARNDPAFADNKYWRGRIWAPMNFLVYLGIRNYSLPDAKKDMVEKSTALLLKSWLAERHVYENYNATSGVGADSGMSDPFYHWGALLGFIDIMDKGYMDQP